MWALGYTGPRQNLGGAMGNGVPEVIESGGLKLTQGKMV